MSESRKKELRFPCHIYGIADAKEAYDSFFGKMIKNYGDAVTLEDGTVLHDNYMWDDGGRILVRCKDCGALMIIQFSEYHSFSDGPDGCYEDLIPAASEEEADLLNILLDIRKMENFPCRHIRRNNGDVFWTGDKEPETHDPEELIRMIRDKYRGVNPELLDRLIFSAGNGTEEKAEKKQETEEETEEPDEEENDEVDLDLPIGCFWSDIMDEIRKRLPEGTKTRALIFDRTEDEDMLEILKMAATLDYFLRTEKTGFEDVHMQIVNEPETDDVSWERTEDGYALHLCAESGKNWCQVAYQLGYLMTHCLIDHLGDDEEGVTWAEELICEAAALKLLNCLQENWYATIFWKEDRDYADCIEKYIRDNLGDNGTSALLRCRSRDELREINERNLFDDRIDESHDLFHAMKPEDLTELVKIREYEADDLLLYTHYWRSFAEGSAAVDYICRLQERIPGCEIPAGIIHEIDLENSQPTEEQKRAFEALIRALNPLPCEYIIFSFLNADRKDREQIGLVFFQTLRQKDGTLLLEIRQDTKQGRKMYMKETEDDEAIAIFRGILDTNQPPDLSTWKDITEKIFQ